MFLVIMCSVRMTKWGRKSAASLFLTPGFSHPSSRPLQCLRDEVVSSNTVLPAPPPPGGGKKAQGQHFWLSHTFLVLKNCRAYKRWWKSKRQSSWCFWHFSRINYYLLNEWINRCWSFHLRRDLITSPYIQWLSAYMASKECKMKWFFSSSDPIFQSLHYLWLEWLLCCLQPVPTPLFGGPGSCIMDAQGHLTWPHYLHGQ